MFTNCLELTPDKANINYQKSIYFELLNDTINSNLFIEEVKKSNLKYHVKDKK
jgi:hypothetical protein